MNAMTTIRRRARMLDRDEELALFRRHADGDRRATDRLLEAHMTLLHSIAGRYSRFGPKHEDIMQEAALGFIQGLERYDPDTGFRINTFCRWWIRAAITEWVRVNHSLVRIGTTAAQKKLFGSLRGAMAKRGIYPDGGLRPEELEMLAKDLGASVEEIAEMSVRLSPMAETSLDASIGTDSGGMTRVDQMVDMNSLPEDRDDAFDDRRRREAVHNALGGLDARQRDIIERRYLAHETETLEEVSQVYGLTRERIRQLEKQAIEQLGLAIPGMLSRLAGQERRCMGLA